MWRVIYLDGLETFAFEHEGVSYFDTLEDAEEALRTCRRKHGGYGCVVIVPRRAFAD